MKRETLLGADLKSAIEAARGYTLRDKIVNMFSSQIDNGIFLTDQKIPSINELAKELQVARDTVERSYQKLRTLGYIKSVPGFGYFIADTFGAKPARVLCLMEQYAHEKQSFFHELIKMFGSHSHVDVQTFWGASALHHIIANCKAEYHYYMLVRSDYGKMDDDAFTQILKKLPSKRTVIIGPQTRQMDYCMHMPYQIIGQL